MTPGQQHIHRWVRSVPEQAARRVLDHMKRSPRRDMPWLLARAAIALTLDAGWKL